MHDLPDVFRERCLGGAHRRVDDHIDPRDEMLAVLVDRRGPGRATMDYLRAGHDLARTVEQIARWRFGDDLSGVRALEFACGYGRNVRHLVRLFAAGNLSVSDIYGDAVTFCRERFGVDGFVSAHDPADLDCRDRFDLIVVPSLFSHLPHATFARWLSTLHGLLTDRGILVFSVHGAHLRPEWDGAGGITFERESESGSLDLDEYGTTHVTEAYVAAQVATATGHDCYAVTPMGFWRHQDFYIVPRRPDPSVPAFRYDHGLIWSLDIVRLTVEGHLELAGWATRPGGRPPFAQVAVTLDGIPVARGPARVTRDQVAALWGPQCHESGFWFLVPDAVRFHTHSSELVVEATVGDEAACLYAGALGASLTADDFDAAVHGPPAN